MKQIRWPLGFIGLALFGLCALTGCESDSSGSSSEPVDVSGSWTGTTEAGTMSMEIDQDGTAVSGSITWSGTVVSGGATFSGEVDGNELSGTYTRANGMSGTVAAEVNGNQMTGTWTQSNGIGASFTLNL